MKSRECVLYQCSGKIYSLENQQEQSEKTGNSYPTVGSTFGEWSVWDLLRGMYTGADYINSIPRIHFSDYLKRVEAHVENKKGGICMRQSLPSGQD